MNNASRPASPWTPARLVLLLIAASAALRMLLASMYGFGNGESYYFSCSRHADLSYFDHPPMHAWLARLAIELGGIHPLVIRLPFILFFAGTTWLTFALGRRLFSERAGLLAAVILNLSMVFSVTTATFFQPDSPLMFFWLLAFHGLVRVLLDESSRHATLSWLGIGLAVGLAMLCKYHAVFLVAGVVAFVITSKKQQHWLRHPGPYLALIVMTLCFLPVLSWNARNEWISFLWQGGRGTEFKGLRFDWLARSIGGQALWLMPWIWLPLIIELVVCTRRGPSDPARWLVACTAMPLIAFFTITALYAPYGFHFHWQAPGYLLLFLPLGATIDRWLRGTPRDARFAQRWLQFTTASFAAMFLILTTHTVNGWVLNLLPAGVAAQAAIHDPTLEALDYGPLETFLAERGYLDRDDLFVCSPKWYIAGKVDYSLHGRANVLCLSPDDPRAYAFFDRQSEHLGQDAIIITHERFCNQYQEHYWRNFGPITHLGTVEIPRGGRVGVRLNVYLGRQFHATLPQPYGNTREATFLWQVAQRRQ